MIKDGLDRRWYSGEISVDMLLKKGDIGEREPDTDFIRLMRDAGFITGELGIENLNESTLFKFNKLRYSSDEAFKVVEALVNADIKPHAVFIHTSFDTTADELVEHLIKLLKFIDRFRDSADVAASQLPVPYIGTGEYRKIMDYMKENPLYALLNHQIMGIFGGIQHELDGEDGYHLMIGHYIPKYPIVAKSLSILDKALPNYPLHYMLV